MPTEQRGTDDLTKINGIGDKVATRLHGLGIHTYAQLAAASAEDIAAGVRDGWPITATRVARQRWVEQAARLAADGPVGRDTATSAKRATRESEVRAAPSRHAFTVEVRLGERGDGPTGTAKVVATRIVAVENAEDAQQWSGWDGPRLLAFVERHLGIRAAGAAPADAEEATTAAAADVAGVAGEAAACEAEPGEAAACGAEPGEAASYVQRFGIVAADGCLPGRSTVLARLRLDRMVLNLPDDANVLVQAQLLAQPVGQRATEIIAERCATRVSDSVDGVELIGALPDHARHYNLLAAVRILASQPPAGTVPRDLGASRLVTEPVRAREPARASGRSPATSVR